jgi:uncharacterized protein (TIGR02594 family)
MSTRRQILKHLALTSLLLPTGEALATDENSSPQSGLPDGIGVEPDFDGPLPRRALGELPALRDEVKTAEEIIKAAPTNVSPFEVAQYFIAVGEGKHGDSWKPYISGWPKRWNPVIVTFFAATNTVPKGDTTAWCAAFVNWCYLRARGSTATKSASSGSFRAFSVLAQSPKPGDLVVMRNMDDKNPCPGTGHVGFFVRDVGESIEILGGNQLDRSAKNHKISIQGFKKDGAKQKLQTIQMADFVLPAGDRNKKP